MREAPYGFIRQSQPSFGITLPSDDAAALHRAAESRGVDDTELVREWLTEKLHAV